MALAASVGSSVLPGVLVLRGLNEVAPEGVSTVPAAAAGWEEVAEDFARAPVPPLALLLLSVLWKPIAHTAAATAASTSTTTTESSARLSPRRGPASYRPGRQPGPPEEA